jgi:hypothetical protein
LTIDANGQKQTRKFERKRIEIDRLKHKRAQKAKKGPKRPKRTQKCQKGSERAQKGPKGSKRAQKSPKGPKSFIILFYNIGSGMQKMEINKKIRMKVLK